MTIRLNGWQWLWIVFCALWAVNLAMVPYLAWSALPQLRVERWTMACLLALLWLVPCLAVYAIGWTTAWIRRSFEGSG